MRSASEIEQLGISLKREARDIHFQGTNLQLVSQVRDGSIIAVFDRADSTD